MVCDMIDDVLRCLKCVVDDIKMAISNNKCLLKSLALFFSLKKKTAFILK